MSETTDRPTSEAKGGRNDAQDQSGIGVLLERNREFANAGAHEAAPVIPNLGLVVITCMDPRTDPAHFLGLRLSDAFVVRNIGGRVTQEVINDLAFISQLAELVIPQGPLFEVALIHHTQCGAGAFADASFRQSYATRIGVTEETLRDHAIVDPAVSVQVDLDRLRAAQSISKRITLSAHVYDVVSGKVQTVVAKEARE
jgi:carbonic anhydrase